MSKKVHVVLLVALLASAPSTAQQITWTEARGVPRNQMVQSLSSYAGGFLFAGTTQSFGTPPSAVYRSDDGGRTWDHLIDMPAAVVALAVTDSGTVLAGTTTRGFFRSPDWGETWEQVEKDLETDRISDLEISFDGEILAASRPGYRSGIYYSSDEGRSWTLLNEGLRGQGGTSLFHTEALCETPNGDLFSATDYAVFISTDGGTSWSETNLRGSIVELACTPFGHVFAGTYSGEIYRTTDSGWTWDLVLREPTIEAIRGIVVNSLGHLYTAFGVGRFSGVWGGVYRSLNNGDTWESIGLTDTISTAITLDANENLIVGTQYGIWRSAESTTETYEQRATLHPHFPSPFSESTTLSFSLENQGSIEIGLFDLLGRHIKTIASGLFPPGKSKLTFDAGDLAAGAYVYRLQVEGLTRTRQMVIVR